MIKINTYPIDDPNLKNSLERIGDLINMDGPLLSLFRDKRNNTLYFFDWTDNDELYNRWLVYKIDANTLSLYINKKIGYKEMFNTVRRYYVTDIKDGQYPPFDIVNIDTLPNEYLPNTNSFFEESDSKNLPKIKSILDDLTEKGKQQKIPFNSSGISIAYSQQYRSIKEQHFVMDFIAFPMNANNVRDQIRFSTLSRQNEIQLNRVLQKV